MLEIRKRAALAAFVGLSGVACDFSGYADLGRVALDDDPGSFDLPATRLLEGRFQRVTVAAGLGQGAFLLVVTDTEPSEIIIYDYMAGTACQAGPGAAVSQLTRIDSRLVLRIDTEADDDGFVDARFVDAGCQPVRAPLPEVRVYAGLQTSKHTMFPMWRRDGSWLLWDADSGQSLLEEPGVLEFREEQGGYWLRTERGELLFVDYFDPGTRKLEAERVTQFVVPAAFELRYATTAGLHIEGPGQSDFIEDVCMAQHGGRSIPNVVEKPCGSASRQLLTSTFDDQLGRYRWQVHPFPREVGPVIKATPRAGRWDFIVESEQAFDLYSATTELPRSGGALELERLAQALPSAEPPWLLNYGDAGGQWGAFHSDEQGTPTWVSRADQVVWTHSSLCKSGTLVLTSRSEQLGDLHCHREADETLIARSIERPNGWLDQAAIDEWIDESFSRKVEDPHRLRTGSWALVTDVRDGAGKLRLYPVEDGYLTATDVPVVAEGVEPGSARPIQSPRGAIYFEAGSHGRLVAYLADPALQQPLDEGVTWFRYLGYPAEAVVYAIGEGPRAGLWIAKAR